MNASLTLIPVQLWCISREGQDVRAQMSLLAPRELAHLDTLRDAGMRDRHVLTRAALRVLLSRWFPHVTPEQWLFTRTSNGRPEVAGPVPAGSIAFNVAHTDDEIILALTAVARVGVDVEALQRKPDALALARRHFQPEEVAVLQALPASMQQRRFLELWTLKEACVKATGQGLARGLRQTGFALDEDSGIALLPSGAGNPGVWQFRQWSLAGKHLVALALNGADKPVVVQWACLQNLQPAGMASEPVLLRTSAPVQARMYSSTNLEP
ncbi:MAG: hypothetical protein RL572_1260 [Pseudomonadota bacterium]